jgi:hypothetical protein
MTVYAGQIIYASDINDRAPIHAYKADDTTRSGTAISDDPDLLVALKANRVYDVHGLLSVVASGDGGDIKYDWDYPDDAVICYKIWGPTTSDLTGAMSDGDTEFYYDGWNEGAPPSTARAYGVTTTTMALNVAVRVSMGATAGDLTFQWGQNANSGSTTVKNGSWITAQWCPS